MIITVEILLVLVVPLNILYLKGSWPLRTTIPCLLVLPLLWYLTYAPLHELCHVAGTYIVGGTVTAVKLIPNFWAGEFGRAWITPEGVHGEWRQLVMTVFPYLFDGTCVVTSILVLRRTLLKNAFVIGLLFMFLCLRPTFDLLCEGVAYLQGDKGDFYHIGLILGNVVTSTLLLASIGFCFYMILTVLGRFRGFSAATPLEGVAIGPSSS